MIENSHRLSLGSNDNHEFPCFVFTPWCIINTVFILFVLIDTIHQFFVLCHEFRLRSVCILHTSLCVQASLFCSSLCYKKTQIYNHDISLYFLSETCCDIHCNTQFCSYPSLLFSCRPCNHSAALFLEIGN